MTAGTRTVLTQTDKDIIAAEYAGDVSGSEVAKKWRIGVPTLYKILEEKGVPRRSKKEGFALWKKNQPERAVKPGKASLDKFNRSHGESKPPKKIRGRISKSSYVLTTGFCDRCGKDFSFLAPQHVGEKLRGMWAKNHPCELLELEGENDD